MAKKFFYFLLFLFHLTNLKAVHAATGARESGVASLLVLIDLSPSMNSHRMKMKQLAPLVKDAMESAQCEFRVAVGSIHYKNFPTSRLTPWAEPGGDLWVTQDTPQGADKIYDRITFPHETVYPGFDGDQNPGIPSSGNETTYSSLVDSINTNWESLQDSDVIGTILLTDAVPAYESYSPKDAADLIKQKVGNRPYLSAMIVANVFSGMMVQPNVVYDSNGYGSQICGPDHEGGQEPGWMLNTDEWVSKNPDAINQFNEIIYGEQWDICEPEYDQKLKSFIEKVLLVGGCLPLS